MLLSALLVISLRMKNNEIDTEFLADPWQQFDLWHQEAKAAFGPSADAMALASIAHNEPKVRFLLYKGRSALNEILFYTNYNSNKAKELEQNPNLALCFYWAPPLDRQVRFEGKVIKCTHAESEKYFQSRPRGSQIAAWASNQSHVQTKEQLEAKLIEIENKFKDHAVLPCPDFWGGYKLQVKSIELMQLKQYRIHDRYLYTPEASGKWGKQLLAP